MNNPATEPCCLPTPKATAEPSSRPQPRGNGGADRHDAATRPGDRFRPGPRDGAGLLLQVGTVWIGQPADLIALRIDVGLAVE